MVTISHLVKNYVDEHPFIGEGLCRGIISHAGLAESIHKKIEEDLRKKIKLPAVIMAIRRYAETLENKNRKIPKKISSEITLRTNVCVSYLEKKNTKKMDHRKIIGLTYGLEDVCVIYKKGSIDKLKGKIIEGLVCITIKFSESYINTSGVLFVITRELAWNNINIVELLSAGFELSIIIKQEDSENAFVAIRKILD
jgi:hypothetical protein